MISNKYKHYQVKGLDELSIKVWVAAIAGANVPILGPLYTWDHF